MPVGGRDGVNALFIGIFYHVQKVRIDVGFALKIKNQVQQIFVQLVNRIFKKVGFEIASRTGKGAESTRTFGAAEVAGSRRFYGNRHG